MPLLTYTLYARDNSTMPPGTRLTGLKPTWVFLKRLADGSDVAFLPVITEIGGGQYRYSYDPLATGEASGQIDLGPTVPAPGDRYVDQTFYAADAYVSMPPTTLDTAALAVKLVALIPAPVVNVPPTELSAVTAGLAAILAAVRGLPTADQVAAAELKALGQRVAAWLSLSVPPGTPPVPTPAPASNLGG